MSEKMMASDKKRTTSLKEDIKALLFGATRIISQSGTNCIQLRRIWRINDFEKIVP